MKTTSRPSAKRKPARRRPSPLREASREAERRLVLEAAAEALAKHGVEGVNVRDVGAAVGASSTIVYKLFGGREQLLAAVYEDGLTRMGAELAKVSVPDPYFYLIEVALTYRRCARANRNFYNAICAVYGLTRPPMPMRESQAYRVVRDGVQNAMDKGVFAPGNAEVVADILWSVVHGNIDLELAGYFATPEESDARFYIVGPAVLDSFRAK